jgi:hypothetical protein
VIEALQKHTTKKKLNLRSHNEIMDITEKMSDY